MRFVRSRDTPSHRSQGRSACVPRSTKAAYNFEQTRNIEVIRKLLGQKSVSATSTYLNVGKNKTLRLRGKSTFDLRMRARGVNPIAMADESCTTTKPNRAVAPGGTAF